MNLKEYLATHEHRGFKKGVRDFGTHVTYFAKEDRCVGEQVDENLTIYRSVKDGEIVGVKIWT